MNLGTYLSRAASYWPDREAVVCGDVRWDYRAFDDLTNRLASALVALGLGPYTPVATYAANRAELVACELAFCKAGLLRVPVNARLAPAEVEHIVADAGVRVVFVDGERRDAVREMVSRRGLSVVVVDLDRSSTGEARPVPGIVGFDDLVATGTSDTVAVEVEADGPAVLNFTSGSTGALKAAVQTHGNRLANMRKRLMSTDAAPGPDPDRYLAPGPITHASGMGVLALLARGSTVVVLDRFDPTRFLATLEAEAVTSTFLVPTMLTMLLEHPGASDTDFSTLRCVRIGGAPVSPQRLRDAVALFGPVVAQGYGQAETTSGVTALTPEDVLRGIESDPELLLSCGRAVFDTEVRVVDDEGREVPAGELGEIVVRGPDCVREYWNAPELSAQTFRDGWVHTGDIGRRRADGYLFLVDRKKDMIVTGGFNVYSTEIEAVLHEHPSVSDACVVGVPDERWGEAVKAVVVLRSGTCASEDELVEHCGRALGRMKRPRSVDFVDALPVNRNGKTDRRAVRDRYWAQCERRVH